MLISSMLSACDEPAQEPASTEEERLEERIEEEVDDLVEEVEEATAKIEEALSELKGHLMDLAEKEKAMREPARLEELEQLLPEEADGLDRIKTDTRGDLIGLGTAEVSATYADDGVEAKVDIVDTGLLAPLARTFASWLDNDIDRESDRGFEQTRPFFTRSAEYPSFESFTRVGDHGECTIMVWVADRYIVALEVAGEGVVLGDCTDVRDELPFRKLERLSRPVDDK